MYARKAGKLVHPGFVKKQARANLAAPPKVGPRPVKVGAPGANPKAQALVEALRAKRGGMSPPVSGKQGLGQMRNALRLAHGRRREKGGVPPWMRGGGRNQPINRDV